MMRVYIILSVFIFFLLSESAFVSNGGRKKDVRGCRLEKLVKQSDLVEGAKSLYNFSLSSVDTYGHPTRVIGSPGHKKTIDYILANLQLMDDYYEFYTQSFNASYSKTIGHNITVCGEQLEGTTAFKFSPSVESQTANFVEVKNEGCNLGDYPQHVAGKFVLVKRGTCNFAEKSRLAGSQGAKAVLIYDTKGEALQGTLGEPIDNVEYAPMFGISMAQASNLLKAPNTTITVSLESYIMKIKTENIIAETRSGDHNNVVMVGAHSDSVQEGPGINDNGSGSITLLSLAKYLSNFEIENAVRFSWWSAEEEGLLGSDYYTQNLSPDENFKIRLFLDYDMLASPNYAFQIYDSDDSRNPPGSSRIRENYIRYYEKHKKGYTLIPLDGRSDYVGFIKNSIPSGGIATGAEGIKSELQTDVFGGESNEAYDKCYHLLCDDLENVNYEAWTFNSKAIAFILGEYAKTLQDFPRRHHTVSYNSKLKSQVRYHGDHLVI